MIEWVLPEPLLWALRWGLLLGPLGLLVLILAVRPVGERAKIGALFALFYGVGLIFVTHQIALWVGWWSYGWDALMLAGFPADILIGGAILFGPVLYLVFPKMKPLWIYVPIILVAYGTLFSSLSPLVDAGPGWFLGVLFVFVVAHIPAIYLAQWTERNVHLPRRVTLLAVMTGALAFFVLPSLIMEAMGGGWYLADKPILAWALFFPLFSVSCLVGLAAAQTLALQGLGTAIPLDPTKRLVRTGIYAYVNNPMQLSAALGWTVLGAFLSNIWVVSAGLMAWVFVQGMVRWHHRHDLLERFPDGWPEYRGNVPEWLPRWKPWVKTSATLYIQSHRPLHKWIAVFISETTGLNLVWDKQEKAVYTNPMNVKDFPDRLHSLLLSSIETLHWPSWAMLGY